MPLACGQSSQLKTFVLLVEMQLGKLMS